MDTKMKIADAPEQMDKSADKKGYIKKNTSALRYDDAYLHFYGIIPVVTVDKINF